MNKHTKKLFISVTTSLIILGSAGAGGYLLLKKLNNHSQIGQSLYNYEYQNEETISGLNIKQAPIPGKQDEFFLSNDGLKKFAGAITTDLDYGPEIYEIPAIYIDNQNLIGDEENGNYLPSGGGNTQSSDTDIINLSSTAFRSYGLPAVKANASFDQYQDIKIALLMQILFHEYGHFLANKYLQSEPRPASQKVFNVLMDMTDGSSKLVDIKWDKYFMDKFEHYLNYDDLVSKDANGKDVHTYRTPLLEGKLRNAKKYDGTHSLGEIYSANEMWQLSNHETNQEKGTNIFTKMKVGGAPYTTGGLNPPLQLSKENAYNYSYDKSKTSNQKLIDSSKFLSYKYSSDEVFTRKYQQIMMPFHSAGTKSNMYLGINGMVMDGRTNSGVVSPFQLDTLDYMDGAIINGKMLNNKDVIYTYKNGYNTINRLTPSGVYMADNPIAAKDNLYDIYAQQVGYKDQGHSNDITVVYYDKDNKVRIGGYVSDTYSKKEKDGTYKDFKVGNKDFSIDTEELRDAKFKMPQDFKSAIMKQTPGLATKFWISKPMNISDVQKLLNKPMQYINIDDKGQSAYTPMKYLKDSNVGLVTTWRSAEGHDHGTHEYHFEMNKNGEIIIKNGSGK